MKFKIAKEIETGNIYLCSQYPLDGDKMTAYVEYEEGVIPDIPEYGMFNFYKGELEIIGDYDTKK